MGCLTWCFRAPSTVKRSFGSALISASMKSGHIDPVRPYPPTADERRICLQALTFRLLRDPLPVLVVEINSRARRLCNELLSIFRSEGRLVYISQ